MFHIEVVYMKIIIVDDVKGYREVAKRRICSKDNVVEFGCGSGKTTKLLAKISSKVLALDKSSSEIFKARERLHGYLNVYIKQIDVWDVRSVKNAILSYLNGRVDILMVDVGGVEDPGKVLTLTWRYMHILKPKLIIIKNRLLNRFLSFCVKDGEN